MKEDLRERSCHCKEHRWKSLLRGNWTLHIWLDTWMYCALEHQQQSHFLIWSICYWLPPDHINLCLILRHANYVVPCDQHIPFFSEHNESRQHHHLMNSRNARLFFDEFNCQMLLGFDQCFSGIAGYIHFSFAHMTVNYHASTYMTMYLASSRCTLFYKWINRDVPGAKHRNTKIH